MRYIFAVCVLTFASTLTAAEYAGSDWPQWLGPGRNSVSPETGWVSKWEGEPKVLWRKKVGTGFGGIAVAEGRAYVMGNVNRPERGSYFDTLYCLDAVTGEAVWEQSYPCRLVNRLHEGGPSSTAAVHAGKVYVLSKVGQVYCFDAATGKPVWQADLGKVLGLEVPEWGFCSSAVVEGEKVIFQAGAVVALDCTTGQVVWKSKPHKPAYGTPAPFDLGGRRMLAVLSSDGLAIVDAKDGREVGFHEWETDYATNATTPIVVGDKVFLSTGYNKGCGLFKVEASGSLTPVYRNDKSGQTMSNHFNNAVLVDGHLYGFDGNSHGGKAVSLVCLEFETGKQRWRQTGFGCGSLIAAVRPGSPQADGKLIVLSDDGRLATAEATAEGFKGISQAQVLGGKCWTMPTLAHGRVYCRNARGDLVCVDLRPE